MLYRLPELLAADSDEWVFVVEGEKDVDNLQAVDLTATTNPGGAGKWKPEFNQFLKGRKVAVVGDNDESGQQHVVAVATSLLTIASDVRAIQLPNLPDRGDVSDWLDGGHTAAELADLVEAATEDPALPPDAMDILAKLIGSGGKQSQADMLVELVINEYRALVGQQDRNVARVGALWTAEDIEVVVDPCGSEVRLGALLSENTLGARQTGAGKKSAENQTCGLLVHGLLVTFRSLWWSRRRLAAIWRRLKS